MTAVLRRLGSFIRQNGPVLIQKSVFGMLRTRAMLPEGGHRTPGLTLGSRRIKAARGRSLRSVTAWDTGAGNPIAIIKNSLSSKKTAWPEAEILMSRSRKVHSLSVSLTPARWLTKAKRRLLGPFSTNLLVEEICLVPESGHTKVERRRMPTRSSRIKAARYGPPLLDRESILAWRAGQVRFIVWNNPDLS
jgi:hypothetical protein